MAQAARSSFGHTPRSERINDLQTTTLKSDTMSFTSINAGDDTFTWPTDTPVVNDVLSVTGYTSNVATLEWAAPLVAAAGSDTEIQFNSSGSLAGDGDFIWDNSGKTGILTVLDEVHVGVVIRGDTLGNGLTIRVQDQTSTNTDGNPLGLYGGSGEGSGISGVVLFGSNFETANKNNGAIEASNAVTISESTGTIIVSTATMGTVAAGLSTTVVCTFPHCKSTSIIQLSSGAEYLTSGGTGYPTPLVDTPSNGSFLIQILNQHSTAAFNSKALTIHYTVM